MGITSHNKPMETAKTILEQIGRNCLIMIGAKNCVALENGVRMMIGRNPKKIKWIAVELMPNDTYTVSFYNQKGEVAVKNEEVYCDQLEMMIAEETELVTAL